jgi:hypothetical protein
MLELKASRGGKVDTIQVFTNQDREKEWFLVLSEQIMGGGQEVIKSEA